MQTETTTQFAEIAEMISRIEDIAIEKEKLNKSLREIKEPEPLKFCETPEQWDEWNAAMINYRNEHLAIKEMIKYIENEEDTLKLKVRGKLPDNIWFRILTNNGERWVGVQTTNWGGGERKLIMLSERPAEPLKHIRYTEIS